MKTNLRHFLSLTVVGFAASWFTGCVTPLAKAAAAGDNDQVSQLITSGADVNAQNGSALAMAVTKSHPDTAKLLLAKGADPNKSQGILDCRDWSRSTAGKVLMLLTLSTDVAIQPAPPLILASANNDPDTVKLLLDAGADINAQVPSTGGYPCNGMTSLIVAAAKGCADAAKALLERGARTDLRAGRFGNGKTALEYAQNKGNAEIAEMLSRGVQK